MNGALVDIFDLQNIFPWNLTRSLPQRNEEEDKNGFKKATIYSSKHTSDHCWLIFNVVQLRQDNADIQPCQIKFFVELGFP